MKKYLQDLNPQQHRAVTAPDGPLLLLAGAGSGKTRVIVSRIAYLIDERGVPPNAILAVTFTNKAAAEMRRRVVELLQDRAPDLSVFTFHAICLRLLRRFGSDIGLATGFSLYAEDERRGLLRRICRELNVAERELPLSRVSGAVSAIKNQSFSGRGQHANGYHAVLLERIAARYQEELSSKKAVDFDDLILKGLELMECSERAQGFAERRFQHVLVDEYQDTNRIQYRLVRLLAPHKHVFVVGDEDQSIYNFRGADLRNILDFEKDFPTAQVLKLETNYRSSGSILETANAVIQNNQARKGKRLVPSLGPGSRPVLFAADDEHEEAAWVATSLLRTAGANRGRSAVLMRTHAQTRVFEEEFVSRSIPHQIVGGLRFYERREIKDVVAYLKLVLNPDDDASFQRVVNVPPRGIGASSLEALVGAATAGRSSLWAASAAATLSLPPRSRAGLETFRGIRDRLRALASKLKTSELILEVLESTGLAAALDRDGSEQALTRKENLDQLVVAAADFEEREPDPSLAAFLDNIGLLSDLDQASSDSPCWIMTLHAAKGLEFDTVFLVGLEEGLFPHLRSVGDARALEEERRLCYVGMTRAKQQLNLSYAMTRRFGYQSGSRDPSRFLREIPEQLLDVRTRGSGAGAPSADVRSYSSPSPIPSFEAPAFGYRPPGKSGRALRPGANVRHEKFGDGRIVDASGTGGDRRLTVIFHKFGRKRLVAQFAKLEVID